MVKKTFVITLFIAILAGILLIILPVSPDNHYQYKGYITASNSVQETALEKEYLACVDINNSNIVDGFRTSGFYNANNLIYWINARMAKQMNLEVYPHNITIKYIVEDKLWVRIIAWCLISYGVITALVLLQAKYGKS